MTRTHYRKISLYKWFPKDDPLATCLARLCILREDFFLEFHGLGFEPIKQLDGNQAESRRLYFFRNIIRTLFEIRGTIEQLQRLDEFQDVLKKQPNDIRDEYGRLYRQFKKSHTFLKKFRNMLGGHVEQNSVAKGLNKMEVDRLGFIEVGSRINELHYRFTSELVLAIMFTAIRGKNQKNKANLIIRRVLKLSDLVLIFIDKIIGIYIKERRLTK